MTKYSLPNVPFVEAHHKGPKQRPTAIVLSLSSTTSDKGAALGIANRLHKSDAPANSYHYIVDSESTFRSSWDNFAAYSSPYRSIDVLICAQPVEDSFEWGDYTHFQVFPRVVSLVAELFLAHKIPVRYLEEDGQKKWNKRKWRRNGGLIVLVPGAWPYERFLADVKTHIAAHTASRRG